MVEAVVRMVGVSNAANLTDGVDGLAAGLAAIGLATLAVFAYVSGRVDTSKLLLFVLVMPKSEDRVSVDGLLAWWGAPGEGA